MSAAFAPLMPVPSVPPALLPVDRLFGDAVSDEALAEQITALSAHIQAATCRLLKLIAAFDQRRGWADWGIHSCAHWLHWKCGYSMGVAREKVRVARALEGLPLISASFEKGEVSYSKVRAMTRIATAENEDYLMNIARYGTAHHLERLVREYRCAGRFEENQLAHHQHRSRSLLYYTDSDGCLVIQGRLPPETGALVIKALQAAMESVSEASAESPSEIAGDVAAATPDGPYVEQPDTPYSATKADALALLAESYLAHGPRELSGADRHLVVVHVDAGVLTEDDPQNDHPTDQKQRCAVESGPSLGADTVRRLCCDAGIVPMTEDKHGNPLDVGRKTRSIPPAMRRALQSRDRGCRFPGCTHQRFVDGHHIRHWADGGETKLSNLVLLCRYHHRLMHEGGFGLKVLDDGERVFTRPDGRRILDVPRPLRSVDGRQSDEPLADALIDQNNRLGLAIDANTGVGHWQGERMDYGIAVSSLWHRTHELRSGHLD